MGKVQALENSMSIIWKWGKSLQKGKINSNSIRYIPKENMSVPKDLPVDEFVRTTAQSNNTRKVITDADKVAFKAYGFQRRLDLNISKEELINLFKLEDEEYRQKAFELLVNKMNIPKDLIPTPVYKPFNNNEFLMLCQWFNNSIAINTDTLSQLDKYKFLISIRHELQHHIQFLNIFRHETKGKEFVEFAAKSTNWNNETLDNYIKNAPEQLQQIFSETNNQRLTKLQEILKTGNESEYKKELNDFVKALQKENLENYKQWQNTIIQNLGVLKADTKEAKRAEKMMVETMDENGYIENGQINYAKYFGDCRENEAIEAQNALSNRILYALNQNKCYIKEVKQVMNESLKKAKENSKFAEEVKENFNTMTGGRNMKDFISYMYD